MATNKMIIELAKEIHDEADHIIRTEADYIEEIAVVDSKRIIFLANKILKIASIH